MLTLPWREGQVIAITGASGSGKSTLLADIRRAVIRRGEIAITPHPPRTDKPVVALFGADAGDAMRKLARAGLGDVRAFLARPKQLSTGQQVRLHLALAMHKLDQMRCRRQGAALLVDEFGSGLDAATIRALCAQLGRWRGALDQARVRIVLATASPAHVSHIAPRCVVELSASNRATISHCTRRARPPRVRIAQGTTKDLTALAPLHYRQGDPATVVRVLVAQVGGVRAGVLAVSMPVLNASWRNLAWPGRFSTGDRTRDAARLNREVRCISRVIVEPAYRSLGVARQLVQHYLDAPITRCTEALAAMGHAAPFFERAGMTAYHTPPPARHARLLDAFDHVGIEFWRLATPGLVIERLRAPSRCAADVQFVERELRLWAQRSGATKRYAREDLPNLLARAARVVTARPIAYAHTRPR